MRIGSISCIAIAALCTGIASAQSGGELTPAQLAARAKAQNVPEIPFDSVPNFLKMPPNIYMGEGIGVATNSKGHIFVYTRSQETRLFEFDAKGTFLREIGEGLYGLVFAHAVRVDPRDNIWVVDEGSNMVIKFNPEGRVVMVMGKRPEAIEGLPALASRTSSIARRMWDGMRRATFLYRMATAIRAS
jgi:streptogramin lyase